MKNSLLLLLAASVLLISCNNNNKPGNEITISDKDGKEKVTIDPTKIKDAMQDMQQRKEELSAMTPLTEDELKALVPQELMGGAQTDLDISQGMGATVANADYKINDSVKITLEVVDCAGPGGAGMFGMQYLNMFNVNSDDDDEYVRTIEFNGGKAFENCKKKRNRCSLTYFSGDRFLITLRGENTGIDALKDVAKSLNIK